MVSAHFHGSRDHDNDTPVTVVGAGPAGLTCAIVLARTGRQVIVRERHRTVGRRFHSDFQGLENWSGRRDVLDELRRSGINTNFDCYPVHEVTGFDAWGKSYPLRSDRPLCYIVRRGCRIGSFDLGLLNQAIEAGVEVRFGDRATEVNGPTVLAMGPRVADAIAAGYVFETGNSDGNWIAFNDALAPLGHSYLLIHNNQGTVASCMFAGFKRQAEYVARTVAFYREKVGLEMCDPQPFGGFACFRPPRTAVQGGNAVIGEQAGFQDALAGFGIRYALRSGVLAGRSLIEGVDYTQLWREELLPLLRTGTSNRFILNIVGQRGWRWILRELSRSDAGTKLRRLYRPSGLTRLLFPLANWRRRRLQRHTSRNHLELMDGKSLPEADGA